MQALFLNVAGGGTWKLGSSSCVEKLRRRNDSASIWWPEGFGESAAVAEDCPVLVGLMNRGSWKCCIQSC